MRLTENFRLPEFTKSPTAIKLGISNNPGSVEVDNLVLLCKHVLQPLRDHYGKPITINSGYRSLQLNQRIGGAKSSQHTLGQAADIDTVKDNADLFFHIRHNLEYDKLIWEFGDHTNPAWVHVSFSENKNRGQVLRAQKVSGKTVYSKMA